MVTCNWIIQNRTVLVVVLVSYWLYYIFIWQKHALSTDHWKNAVSCSLNSYYHHHFVIEIKSFVSVLHTAHCWKKWIQCWTWFYYVKANNIFHLLFWARIILVSENRRFHSLANIRFAHTKILIFMMA